MLGLVTSLVLLHAAPPIDGEALRRHLDQQVPQRLQQTGIPGVVIAVSQGDRVVLAAGWGQADVESGRAMSGESTVVRVASISKTFTATAIAQLEAEGRIDLDAPVDEALRGLALPRRDGPPVTLRHLLGHTAGIINDNVGRVGRTPPVDGLAAFLTATMPPRVRDPGRVVLYSNHGNALAGLVVEQVTGTPFAEHMERSLLEPLGMEHSSFELPPDLREALATGYTTGDDGPEPYEYLYFRTVPASALHTTAADMGRWMAMHLSGGRGAGGQVLHPEAHRRMRETVFGIHPALPTYHYAFAHGHTAGHPSRSHGGSVPAFLSRMVLFDEQGVGIFVAQNAFGDNLTTELVESIAARVLPPAEALEVIPLDDGRPHDPAALRGSYDRATKLDTPAFTNGAAQLVESRLEVGLDGDGFLLVDGDRFLRTGEGVFQRAREGQAPETVVFVRDEQGVVRWVHRELSSAERAPWHASQGLHWAWLITALLLLLGLGARSGPSRPRASVVAARLALLGAVAPYVAVAWIDAGQVAYLRPLRFGFPPWLLVLRLVLPVAVGLAWVAVVRAWARPQVRRVALCVAVAATALPLWELYWRAPAGGLEITP